MDSDYNYRLDMDFLSVRTTSLDNTFCQLRLSENLQNELSSPIEKTRVTGLGTKQR